MAKQVQITKSWAAGSIPESKGRYILCGADYSAPRFIDAVTVGNGVKVFNMDGTEVRQDATLRHFGPLPGQDRSIAASARFATEPTQAS
jgi:hypothetical protein